MITSKLPEFLQFVYQVQDFLTTSNCNSRGWALGKVEELPALRALKFSFSSVMCYFLYQLLKGEKKYGWMISLGYAHGGTEEVLTLIKQFFIERIQSWNFENKSFHNFLPAGRRSLCPSQRIANSSLSFSNFEFLIRLSAYFLMFFVFGGSFSFFKKVKN